MAGSACTNERRGALAYNFASRSQFRVLNDDAIVVGLEVLDDLAVLEFLESLVLNGEDW